VAAVVAVLGLLTHLRNRHYHSGVRMWTDVVEQQPNNARAQLNLAMFLDGEGRVEEAIPVYKRCIALGDYHGSARLSLGRVYAAKDMLQEAVEHYRMGLAQEPSNTEARCRLADALGRLGRAEEAVQEYRKALDLDGECVDAHYNLANLLVAEGRLEEARLHYRAVGQTASEQQRHKIHAGLAAALAAEGRYAEAAAEYREALAAEPRHVQTLNNLAWLLATCPEDGVRDGAQAVPMAERACDAAGQRRPDLLDTLAAAHAEAGDFAKAVEIIDEAIAEAEARGGAWRALLRDFLHRKARYSSDMPFRETRPATRPSSVETASQPAGS